MAIIHVLDKQTDEIIETLNSAKGEYTDAKKTDTLDNRNTFEFIALKKFEKLEKRNRLLVGDVDGFFSEYLITFTDQYKHNEKEVRSVGSFVDLQKSKVIPPQKLEGQTPQTATQFALDGTEYLVGDVDFVNIRTITIEEHTNPYDLLKLIASTFDLELRFRVEVRGNQIIGRYVDLKKYVGHFEGKEIVFGKDLVGIRRIEDSDNIVTALLGIGPEREDGTRLTVLVENEEAKQRWGRNGQHLISVYEPESTEQNMTEARLRTLTENELKKRIDASVRYEGEAVSLEKVFGLHHEKIRCGMTVRIKDEGYSPPLYLQARIHETTENPATREITSFKIGDFIEYRREDLERQVKALRSLLAQKVSEEQVRRRLEKLILVSIISSAGSVFKNGIGSTTLTARTFLSGNEVDEDGTRYEYRWHKFDKNGDHDAGFYEEGKTITVNASEIDEKASFRVEIMLDDEVLAVHEITLTNVYDGEDGEQGPPGPPGEEGQGVDNITIQYYLSDSDSTPTGGTWTETKPTYQLGKYLWIRQKITYKNPTVIEYTTPVLDDSWKAIEIAEGAKDDALKAVTTADGKNTVIFSTTEPSIEGRKIGDVWFDTSRDNLMHRFDGTQWVEAKWGEQSIVANSITANHIKSLVGLNVNDQFVVDSDGNVKFAGHLEGASGTFGEVTVKDGDFYLEDNQSLTKYSVVTKQNFIIDHSFESIQADDPQSQDDIDKNWSNAVIPEVGSPWVAVGTPRCVPNGFHGPPPYDARPIFGDRSIAVNNSNYVFQDVYKISPGTYYTISLFAKRVYNMPAGSAQIVVQHIRPLPNGTETVLSEKSSSTMVVRGDYKPVRMATTYLYNNFQDGDFLRIMFKSTNSNWVMVDGVQFVEGNYPTTYNSEDSFHDFMHGRIRWGHFVGENTILAYGESDNGHFVRFGNGFQICWINKTVTVTISAPYGSLFLGYYQWTFPATFISPPTVSCSYFKWGTGASWGTINEVSTTNASLRGIDSFERNAGSTRISAVAMGWWK